MRIGKSIEKAINEMQIGDTESAMLHACNAVDGTAKKRFPREASSNARFTNYLRENYLTLGVMGAPGIDLEKTRFPVNVARPKAPDGGTDFADVIYGIHRCCHGHGESLPQGFELIQDASGPAEITRMAVSNGTIQLSDRVVFGLLATCVFSPLNVGELVPDGFFLTLGSDNIFLINEWWGRASDFEAIASSLKLPSVKLDFGSWTT